MPTFSCAQSARVPVVVDGDTYYKTDWMGGHAGPSEHGADPAGQPTAGTADLSPSVYLVEQLPGVSLRTHFHRNNQFQLIVRGSGSIGPHAVAAVAVHYAGAYSGYGPLLAGPQGLDYFTLRTVHESGSLTMKDHAVAMRRGPKRQLTSEQVPLPSSIDLTMTDSYRSVDLIAPQPDGIAARLLSLAPHASHVPDRAVSGAVGQFCVVLAGTVITMDRMLGLWDSVFIGAGEQSPAFSAGDGGAQWVSLHMPPKDAAYA